MERSRSRTPDTVGALVTLVFGFVLGLAVAWIYWAQREGEREKGKLGTAEAEPLTLEQWPGAPAPRAAAEGEPESDDLTRIEGIGPKIAGLFQDAGIFTFARLAASRPDELSRILGQEDERLARLADPTTWPQQASLAAANAWGALEDLQKELTAGRRA
jgi:predicted flap endonuclease-1-like 5' DNA nuclease